ncbi:hypothetical protein Tco_0272589 [Tanacetum coccineum]
MDDYLFTTIKVVSRHEDTLYGAILPDKLTNEAIKDFESYKEYYAIASGAEPPKTKASVKKKQVGSDMSKTPPTKGKRLKTSAKAAKTAKKKQPAKTSKAKGLTVLSEKSSEEEDNDEVAVNDDDDDNDDDNKDVDNQDDDGQEYDEHDDEEQDSDEEIQDANVEGDKMNEEETNEEAEVDALYMDVNINLEGRDTKIIDAPLTIIQTTQVIEDTHVIITLVNPEAISSILGIVDAYLANKMHEAVKTVTVNEQLEAEVLTRSSNESKTSHAIAANLSELELKKILIDKMESNKSIHRSDEQKNLYKALVDAYESDKLILDTYGDTVSFKRRRDDEDKDKEPPLIKPGGQRKELKRTKSLPVTKEKTPRTNGQKPAKPPTPDRDWYKTLPEAHGPVQPWLSSLAQIIIAVTKLQIVEWRNYKHLDWITVRKDDDKLYTFKEADFNRLRIQDIEDNAASILVQGKLTNLTVEERLLLISDVKQREAYTAYSNPRGFIYQNKDKKNRSMRIDKLHKFSDGTLNDVQTALNDRLKEIRMKYLPQTIWRQSDRDKAGAMIPDPIDK